MSLIVPNWLITWEIKPFEYPCMECLNSKEYISRTTVPAPIKDAASIQKLFFEPMHYDAFCPKSFTLL